LTARSIVPAGRIWRPWNVLQYLPQYAWQLGDVHRDTSSRQPPQAEPVDKCAAELTIIEECVSLKLPAMHTFAFEVKNGALMSYGVDIVESYRRTAEYIDRILKGTTIPDLPFQEPTRLTLAINLQTAHAIGINVPSTLLALADEVIE
jgi:hypothetical protein